MKDIHFSVKEISKIVNGDIIGNKNIYINKLTSIENAKNGDLSVLHKDGYLKYVAKSKASAIIIDKKSGIKVNELKEFYEYCSNLGLNIIGTMCLPPINDDPEKYFLRMNFLNKKLNFKELSMGMSSDYMEAIKHNSTYLRIGTNIFGKRTI